MHIYDSLKKLVFDDTQNVYNFKYTSIVLPSNFKDSIYVTKLGPVKNVAERSARYLEYGKMLMQLSNSCDQPPTLDEVQKNFIKPSDKGTNKQGEIRSLFYYFNPINNSNCYDVNQKNGAYKNCNVLTFEFNSQGVLNGMDGIFFYE
jgi:hypothetical protein